MCGEAVQEIENVEKEKKKMKEEFCIETSQNILEEILSETILQLSQVHGAEVYELVHVLFYACLPRRISPLFIAVFAVYRVSPNQFLFNFRH